MTEGFQHAIAGGQGNLVISQLQSPNFKLSPLTGWAVLKNGAAYFADVTVSGSFMGTDFLITDAGIFLYSGTPGVGNLVASMVPGVSTVTDPEGNTAQPGVTSYAAGTGEDDYSSLFNAQLLLSLAGMSTPASIQMIEAAQVQWNSGLQTSSDSPASILLQSAEASGSGQRVVQLVADLLNMPEVVGVTASGTITIDDNIVITGTLSVNGSTDTGSAGLPNGDIDGTSATAGLPNGGIQGTSGSASTGTAHTHGPGSYSVTNGQHDHGAGSYAVTDGVHSHAL